MSQAEPWELLSELREEIMCNEADNSGQDIQDEAKSGLWGERKEAEKNEITMKIKHVPPPSLNSPEKSEKCVARTGSSFHRPGGR